MANRSPEAAPAAPTTEPSMVELVTLLQRRLARGLSAALAEEHTTLDQWRVMRAVADGRGHLMGELAGRLLIAHPTLTRIVDGLVDGSLLYRRQSTLDRRRVAVHLSRRGHERLARLDALVAGYEGTLSAGARNEELIGLLRELSDSS